jgi:hypothetical protein
MSTKREDRMSVFESFFVPDSDPAHFVTLDELLVASVRGGEKSGMTVAETHVVRYPDGVLVIIRWWDV